MKQSINPLQGRPLRPAQDRLWLLMLAVLFAWLLPQKAAAQTYVDKPENYSVSLGGTNIIYFTAPAYDMDGADCWVSLGSLKVSGDGIPEQVIFTWDPEANIDNDNTSLSCNFSTTANGFFDITLGNSRSVERLTKGNDRTLSLVRNSDGTTFDFDAEWVLPYNLLGKTLTFSWDVVRNGNGRSKENVKGLKTVTVKVPAAASKLSPTVSFPMLNPNNPGKIELPWFLASDNITKAYYEYYDANGKYQKVNIEDANSGTIMLDATVPHSKFRIVCSYKEKGDKGEYEIEGVASSAQNLTMIHAPAGLSVRPLNDQKGKIEVKWNVPYLDAPDLTPTDFFEIQRSLTGKEEDFETIFEQFYAKTEKKSTYTYIDSTLIEAIEARMLKNGGTLDSVTYRVRRTISKDWGWGTSNNCAASATCVLDKLHLLRIANYSAKWESEQAYTVRVSWDYADEIGGVWDDRAKMILHITSKNRDGGVVEDQTIELNNTERAKRYTIVNFFRPCVTYDIEMYVDKNESPLNDLSQLTDYFFPIRTAEDWNEFAEKINNAKNTEDINARLYADIEVSELVGVDPSAYYRGTFDGNGHTVTFNKSNWTEEYVAPFRYVGNATFRSLHTAGTVNSSNKYAGGLIAEVLEGSAVTIENCRSSMTINSSVNGDANNGGFIGVIRPSSRVIIRTSKFDGSFTGDISHSNGGFVGWTDGGSHVIIDNCLFAPTTIRTKTTNCETWTRNSKNITLTLSNSYAVTEYEAFIIIRNADDWHKFAVMINGAENQYDVKAVLDADITVDEHVGVTEGATFCGTFDGNGHTLTFNKTITSNEKFMAPFRHASNATIRNLHVAGTITSESIWHYPAGLVAQVKDGTVTIENCRSSVTLNSTVSGEGMLGGFVGRVSNSNVTIRNSKFDGSFTGNYCTGNGGFISWVDNMSTATIDSCLFAPTTISTKYDKCQTWARQDPRATVTVTNSHATRDYGVFPITSTADWDTFVQMVEDAKNEYLVDAILMNDITVTSYAGGHSAAYYRGTFDGNGHTLNVNIDRTGADNGPAAPFAYFGDATIKNLHVTGTVKGGTHSAGLMGHWVGTPTITIDRVWVSTNVTTSSRYAGGVLGHAGEANVNVTDVRFDGKVVTNNQGDNSYAGSIIGWAHEGSWTFHRVYNASENTDFSAYWIRFCIYYISGDEYGRAWGSNSSSSNTITRTTWGDWGTTYYNKSDQTEVMNLMNGEKADSWTLDGGKAVPVLTTTAGEITETSLASNFPYSWKLEGGKLMPEIYVVPVDPATVEKLKEIFKDWTVVGETIVPPTTTYDYNYATFPKPVLPNFYHVSNGKIDKTLVTTTRQSSVLLAWNTDGNPIDYFTVKRRVKGEGDDKWKEIATNIDQMSYEDTSVSPLAVYEYKVIAVNDCEGITTTETEVKVGECKHTGRLEGYVRFNDGTSAPDVKVSIYHVKGTTKTLVKDVITDESGYFEADELSYYGGESVEYNVVPVSGDNIKLEVDDYSVTFNATSNNETLHEFIITNGKRFSGFVMFDGTSIPVKGVNFLVNGRKMHNAKGEVLETNYDGSFSFRVMGGDNTIQAVMDNHVFTNDGYFKGATGHNFTDDVAGIYFYDATKVKLTGRVVGGNDQGQLPLGNNLSKNNLGDSLTMVLTLEGDNTSWLVYDNLNPNLTKRDTTYVHPRDNGHKTQATIERKRMEVLPDPVTGEYELLLPPVRWKVQQVYCKGYPTLFQEGQVSEVIDLTKCLVSKDTTYVGTFTDVDKNSVYQPTLKYHAIYNRIYRNPIEISYKQIGYDDFDYFGDKTYIASELTGKQTAIPLAYKNPADTTQALYTFTYPVFSLERKYNIRVQVAETYPYNNDLLSGKVDYVKVGGGVATIHNGLKNGAPSDTLHLDANGQAIFTVQADQTTTLLSGENALKTISFSVAQDGNYYESAPLNGYVLNMFPIGQSQDVMAEGVPVLYDILRDPPGGYSTNTLAKGTTINYTYMMNLQLTAGAYFSYKGGSTLETLNATVAAPLGSGKAIGPIDIADTWETDADFLMYTANGTKAFSHTMVVGNNISTSGDPSMVGADADLYIGSVQNVVVTPMSTIRAVTKKMFNEIAARQGLGALTSEVGKYDTYGTVVKIAEGMNDKGDTIYLIRDVALGYGPKFNSQFVYSQKQLLNQIIPAKAKEIVDLMYIGTKADAQTIANNTQKPVYLSLRQPTDSTFAVVNRKIEGHAYNTTIDKAEKGINYLVVLPSGKKEEDFTDEVTEKYQVIKAWLEMISQNEGEKLQTRDLLANYDVGGAQGVNYSETFDVSFTNSMTQHFPIATEVDYWGLGKGVSNVISLAGLAVTLVGGMALSMAEMKTWSTPNAEVEFANENNGMSSTITFWGKTVQWTLVPVVSFTMLGTDSEAKSYNRTESFTIACDPASHLNVDVYRGWYSTAQKDNVNIANVFTNDNFNKMYDEVKGNVEKSLKSENIVGPRGFIFRTRGGSTQNPWEDQRVTQVYDPGTVLDARTLKIVNPKIRLDKQSVSGVGIDDAAKFTVYISNESEKPEATDGSTILQVFAPDQLNPLGAKISINGQPLTTAGITVTVVPGIETALTMEVRAGEGFDFEGLTVGVMSPTDADHTTALTSFDVHYLREAGAVTIATPGDKWVLNTNAQKDSERGWYIPVTINGFDRHQHNFDHIEFQYKESQRGDDSWTNLCSFYADSTLMANANGVRKMIPENGNIVTEFFGEGWTMERTYDLRAVLFCRNGNDYLTTSSKIISGIKDTRRPQLFGTPEPTSGLLTAGDDIIFNFSEDIEYNYLSAVTNFEVKGEVNNDNLSEMVSVQFTGKASVETEAKRNFSNKNLTIDMMVKPAETGREMPLFSHGINGQKLQLWLTENFKLKAVVNEQTFVSDSTISGRGFNQVAMVLNQTDSVLTFYNGGLEIGRNKLKAVYTGTGTLIFGRTNEADRSQSQYYEGRMMEARLWYSAMNGGQIGTTYGNRRLTGYEKDLVDYYPMNEGSGDYVNDHTQGANAKLIGASWAVPRGLSLHLEKADKGVLLNQNALNRSSEHDYTLMFWFKTDADGRGALLSNGRGVKEDIGAVNQFHIGFEADKLMYRSNGFVTEVPGDWSDGNWHHFAITVNRARNVANIYVDKEVRTNFEPDSLGGISGGYPLIGATRYDKLKENGDVEVVDGTDAMKGNIDELMFFAQALPERLISTYATKSPNGDEAGLMTYLAFDRQERQKDNSIELVPYAYSKKIYLDDKGQPRYQLDPLTKQPTSTLVRDYLFVESADSMMKRFDNASAAPVKPYEEVKNLKFSFIGRDNQLLVDLDEKAAKLNHRNIYVTVRDIEDKNGNTMASPQTACYYVTNSSLQWVVNRTDQTIKYGSEEELTLPFCNNSGRNHTYKIENCPKWLTLNKYTDVLAPQAVDAVIAKVSKDLNIGTYNEILYLTDEDGLSEPFYLNLTVEGETPEWAQSVNSDLLKNSMNIIGQVYLYDELDTDARDIVGAFDDEGVCHGFSNISNDAQTGELYLTVYDNQSSGRKLSFRLWQYSTGREIVLTTKPAITFQESKILGTDTPVRFDGGDSFVQYFRLYKGWNWVSFNILSEKLFNLNNLLKDMSWTEGDIITELGGKLTLTYQNNQWLASGSTKYVVISPKKSYAIKVQKPITFPIGGTVIKAKDERTITLKQGWNGIGYTPVANLSVETALSDYYDNAEDGDVIKSHTEFAYFTKTGNTGRWRGSLQYMKPGEGYMMLRKAAEDAKFTYPFYEPGSNFTDFSSQAGSRRAAAKSRTTMTVSAVVEGFEVEEGDRLVAYSNGDVVGESLTPNPSPMGEGSIYYLSIAGDEKAHIWFAIERDGEIVAATDEVMSYAANAVIGSPDEPTAINFVHADTAFENGMWYTIGGVKLPKRPTHKGVYIFNGKKVVVK